MALLAAATSLSLAAPAAEPHALEPPRAPMAGAAAALCLHGRAVNQETTERLRKYFADDLNADIFAISVDAESSKPEWASRGQSSLSASAHDSPVAVDLRTPLNATGRLVALVPTADPPEEQVAKDVLRGSWAVWEPTIRKRFYLDLSNRLQCAALISEHERLTGKQYTLLAHARMDLSLLAPLPSSVASTWRSTAEAAPSVPHLFKPFGDDHSGVIDILAIGNPAGFAVEVSLRDAITAGLVPFNVKLGKRRELERLPPPHDMLRPVEAGPFVYPEQMTAGHLLVALSERGLVLGRREAWPMCRLDQSGSCRYPGEVLRLLRAHPRLVEQNARIVCESTLARRGDLLANSCCEAPSDGERWLRVASPQSEPACSRYVREAGWKGAQQCAADWSDRNCCQAVSECDEVVSATRSKVQ